jgi:hypothetical protein
MKLHFVYLYTFFFFSFAGFAQEVVIKSDKDSKPIPHVTIKYYNNDSIVGGVYTNEQGVALLQLDSNVNRVEISHLSYQTRELKINQIDPLIYLTEKTYNLAEIIISKSKAAPVWIGNKLSKKKTYISSSKGFEVATLIQNEGLKENHNIKSLKFSIKRKTEQMFAVLKINFYKNLNNSPSEIINNNQDITIVVTSKMKGDVIVDLNKYDIAVPAGGIFVGLEWLGLLDGTAQFIDIDSYNDSGIAFNKVDNPSSTFIRNQFSNIAWDTFNSLGDSPAGSNSYITPAFSLEIQ